MSNIDIWLVWQTGCIIRGAEGEVSLIKE